MVNGSRHHGRQPPKSGAPGRIRTCDLKLRRLVLYPAELRARGVIQLARFGKDDDWHYLRAVKRFLTDGEIALCRTVFGDALELKRVTLRDGAGLNPVARIAFRRGNPAITLGRRIYFRAPPPADFSAADDGAKSLFIHEMTHVWQYQRLTLAGFLLRYADEYLAHGRNVAKLYDFAPGETRFAEATLEAQAEIVSHYALARARKSGRAAALALNMTGSGLYGGL